MSLLKVVRWWIPAVLCAVGFVVFALEPTADGAEKAVQFWGAGLAVLLFNVLVRIGNVGDRERSAEDDARRFFDEHGRWPDDPAPPDARRDVQAPGEPPPRPKHRGPRSDPTARGRRTRHR